MAVEREGWMSKHPTTGRWVGVVTASWLNATIEQRDQAEAQLHRAQQKRDELRGALDGLVAWIDGHEPDLLTGRRHVPFGAENPEMSRARAALTPDQPDDGKTESIHHADQPEHQEPDDG